MQFDTIAIASFSFTASPRPLLTEKATRRQDACSQRPRTPPAREHYDTIAIASFSFTASPRPLLTENATRRRDAGSPRPRTPPAREHYRQH